MRPADEYRRSIALPILVRITLRSVPLLAAAAFAASCGSTPDAALAKVHCDAYASPGRGAAQGLADRLGPGKTGCLRPGTYFGSGPEGYVLRLTEGGRRRAPVTIRSAPGGRARLRGVIYAVKGADHITLRDLDLDVRRPRRASTSQVGIQVLADHFGLRGNTITNGRTRSCVIITDGARRTVIRDNHFQSCGDRRNGLLDHAIYAADSRKARIVGNVFWRSAGFAVQLYPRAQRSLVARNLIWDNGGGIVFGGDGSRPSSGNVVEANVIGGSRQRAEITSSFAGGRPGTNNIARSNCLAPGSHPSDAEYGFRLSGNRVASGGACLDASGSLERFRALAPTLVSSVLSRR